MELETERVVVGSCDIIDTTKMCDFFGVKFSGDAAAGSIIWGYHNPSFDGDVCNFYEGTLYHCNKLARSNPTFRIYERSEVNYGSIYHKTR